MTTPGMQGEVSPESMGKMHRQPSEARPTRNPPLPQLLGNTAEQSRLKPCTGKPFELSNELELESQKGNPGSIAAMGAPDQYPWTVNVVWKLLHNDPATLSLFAGNPFPDHPPRYIRAVLYIYHFARPGNPEHVYWTRDKLGLWLPAYSVDSADLRDILRQEGWNH